jgi:hypothetical protein
MLQKQALDDVRNARVYSTSLHVCRTTVLVIGRLATDGVCCWLKFVVRSHQQPCAVYIQWPASLSLYSLLHVCHLCQLLQPVQHQVTLLDGLLVLLVLQVQPVSQCSMFPCHQRQHTVRLLVLR